MRRLLNWNLVSCAAFCLLASATLYHFFFWHPGGAVATLARPERFGGATVVIDAGHGGEDGGAVSPVGNVESHVNLAIAKRLDAILGLYGADVVMLRSEDISLHDPEAETLRQKKVSDLHNRVAQIESLPNPTLISIHQNTFQGSPRYHGAQVFYSNPDQSLPFAQSTQEILRLALDPANGRSTAKIPDTVYLMKHITCRAILVECGFLSNPAEDALLQTDGYRTKIAAALAASYLGFREPITNEESSHES